MMLIEMETGSPVQTSKLAHTPVQGNKRQRLLNFQRAFTIHVFSYGS